MFQPTASILEHFKDVTDPRIERQKLHQSLDIMVSAWASEAQVVLGQRKVADKSNEMTAISQLLEVLALEGGIVTIDAIGTQTKIARSIVEHGADYVLSVNANQATLLDDIRYVFQEDQAHHFQEGPYDYAKTGDKGHGRLELRECWSVSAPEYLLCLRHAHKWANLKSLVMLKVERRIGRQREVTLRYYIPSLATSAADFLRFTRGHWELDIAFREDDSRVRKDHAPQNFAVLRHIALNLLKQEKTARGGIKAKRLQCGWNEQYLLKVLGV